MQMKTGFVLRIALLLMLAKGISTTLYAQARNAVEPKAALNEMVLVPDGVYTPLYKSAGESGEIRVASFYMDAYPVTNAAFLAFVTANPKWRRSAVKRIFADETYLRHWSGDLDLGDKKALLENAPVTNVSWFAARAYAKWKGKRLPTLAEWEYVAAASKDHPYGSDEPGFNERILAWYGQPTPDMLPPIGQHEPNYWGIYDLHGLVWEWVSDFNSALITGESRADAGLERKLYCGSGSVGSSDVSDYAAFMRYAFQSSLKGQYTVPNLGFRCAKDRVQ